ATRAAAYRMADLLGEPAGRTAGYRIRMESRVGPETRVEVVTEGILTGRNQGDPSLEGVGMVIFDEFHERSLHADVGLALCLDAREGLREDLRILIMSATLDAGPAAKLLGGAPVITCRGQGFPVETRYRKGPAPRDPVHETAAAVNRAMAEESGDILVFLPGVREIRRVAGLLEKRRPGPGIVISPLFGSLPRKTQDRAIAPSPPGSRKVVLATSIAETSLTIEGIRVVIDSGLMRAPRFDARSGMSRLKTLKTSRDSADQRRGRAGRTAPGICFRLWSREVHGTLAPHNSPEILNTDLTQLALELARWGVSDPSVLAWLDPPPPASFSRARDLLFRLGALDARGQITRHGKKMADAALHPRLAHMIIRGKALGLGALARELAVLLNGRDILYFPPGEGDVDIRTRVEVIRAVRDKKTSPSMAGVINHGACRRMLKEIRDLTTRFRVEPCKESSGDAGILLAFAYPDRIARRRPGARGRFLLSNGRGAFVHQTEPLSAEEYLTAANLDGDQREARVFLAAPLYPEDLENHFGDLLKPSERVAWDPRKKAVSARRRMMLGKLIVKDDRIPDPDPGSVTAALLEGVRQEGPGVLPWSDAL
ncbi:MAG: ATP-dependent helicase HrpB, partial [Desulfobacterales bacterium]|nr:ATP-dependent helicase HrpB [Desulfobacterales bacterium]